MGNFTWASEEEKREQFEREVNAQWDDWGSEAWQTYEIFSEDEFGKIRVLAMTNDDDDDGYPDGTIERWWMEFSTVEQALKHCGKSRVGISGVRVTVFLDGREIT
jgi:hypothetical protein